MPGILGILNSPARYGFDGVAVKKVILGKARDVFPGKKPILATSLDHQHAKVRELLKLPEDFVVHSLRHTMLTRLGLLGVDAFTIMRIAGHNSITISQRYVML